MLFRKPRSPSQGPSSSNWLRSLSPASHNALALSREEALRLRHDYVGTEHVLLGLTREQSRATALLTRLGVDLDQVRGLAEASVRPGKATICGDLPPLTSRTKKALELALAEAQETDSPLVEPEHILLGLLREESGIAAEVLTKLGVSTRVARRIIRKMPVAEFRVEIDDASELSIYEQIIARIQEAAATGELRPGDRLPTVRQLADQLDIAPGTVARAYSALERLGVVVTEGTRGTRVADRSMSSMSAAERPKMLIGLLRPAAVAAFHLGATAQELRNALEEAMRDIFHDDRGQAA